jgi:outer membrane protein assembly factor BamB
MNSTNPGRSILLTGWLLLSATCVEAQDWPQWRGPGRDGKSAGFTAPATWPRELTQKWKIPVGKGDASPALVGNQVFVFARQGAEEVTLCVDAATGKVVWEDKYPAEAVKGPAIGMWGSQGGPRSSPAVAEGKVCTYGIGGVLSCLDAATGKVVWRKASKGKPHFYTASSPMIVEGKCIAFVGGDKGSLTAYDLASGEPQWEWTGAAEPYGSAVLMTIAGTKQIVTPALGTIAGIRLADGKLLWQVKFGAKNYLNSLGTPIINGSMVCYFGTSPKNGGSTAMRIEKQGDEFSVMELWKQIQIAAPFSTPVLKDGLLYGISPTRDFFCMDAKTGELLWTDKSQRGQCGAIVDAGSILLALTSDAQLVAFQPDKKGFVEVAKYKVADTATWAYPIVSGNRVFIKDTDSLALWTIE